jgi:hypothetical protein
LITESEVGFATATTRQNSGVSRELEELGGMKGPAVTFVDDEMTTLGKFNLVRSSHFAALV